MLVQKGGQRQATAGWTGRGSCTPEITNANTSWGQVNRPATCGQLRLGMALTSAVASQCRGPSQEAPIDCQQEGTTEVHVASGSAQQLMAAELLALEARAPGLRALTPAGLSSWTGTSNFFTFFPFPQSGLPPPNPLLCEGHRLDDAPTPCQHLDLTNISNLYLPHHCFTQSSLSNHIWLPPHCSQDCPQPYLTQDPRQSSTCVPSQPPPR